MNQTTVSFFIANPWKIIIEKIWCNNRVKSHHIKHAPGLTIKNKKQTKHCKSQYVWPFNNKNKKCIGKSQLVWPSNLNLHGWMRIIQTCDKRMSIVEQLQSWICFLHFSGYFSYHHNFFSFFFESGYCYRTIFVMM